MPFTAETIALSAEERDELEQMTRSRSLPAADIFRARLILMLAEECRIEPFKSGWGQQRQPYPAGRIDS